MVIGLLCTVDGIPIAHHVFAGNTADASTLPDVLADLTDRFAVERICVVADRGLISADNVAAVAEAGCDHVSATRSHRDKACQEALETITADTEWIDVPGLRCRAVEAAPADGARAVIVESDARISRDIRRTAEPIARTETQLLALEERVRAGRLADPAKIGRAAQRIIGPNGVARLFDPDIGPGRFVHHYEPDAHAYKRLLAGRYVLTTSLTADQATAERVVAAHRQLADVEARFRTLKDFGWLRPIRHWTEQRVRGHIAVCVYAAVAETLIARDLQAARIEDPDLPGQHLTAVRALRELDRVREVRLRAADKPVTLTTRPSPLQTAILVATGTPTRHWDKARIG